MIYQDLMTTLIWWAAWVFLGWVGWPLTKKLFGEWENHGYLLAKALGAGMTTFCVWILGTLHIIPFTNWGIWGIAVAIWGFTSWKLKDARRTSLWQIAKEELLFLVLLLAWAWVKAHEPTINGLEKFMDYGFTKSIMQGAYFPPKDMWFAGEPINYYYFGHLMMGLASKLSGINLSYGFNLMLATIFAICGTMSWAIGRELLRRINAPLKILGAYLTAFLVTLGGNLHTIYAFTKGYAGDNPPPFWTIWSNIFNKADFELGWKAYWYPNATRFIPFTIHEFPSYSFVVSDMHGHVLSIPFSLLLIALLILLFRSGEKKANYWITALYGWVVSWSMMTNALDGPIYMGTLGVFILASNSQKAGWKTKEWWIGKAKMLVPAIAAFFVGILPFLISFKSFVSGVAVNCPPKFLENTKLGPLLFETTDKCQKSPLWMMLILWGFFIFNAIAIIYKKTSTEEKSTQSWMATISAICLGLIIFPEFFYFKDIYPMHFRSNTMFKLGYQAFIMMGILSGYTITQFLAAKKKNWIYLTILAPLLFLVTIYPNFAVKSYFGDLKTYQGLFGLNWLAERYPDDAAAVGWLLKHEPYPKQPTILEANGDSYTDYERISAFTGLPTIAGWTVHEWLWRGDYAPIAQRAEEVRKTYETENLDEAKATLAKYKVKYVIIGNMEREKYININEAKFSELGKIVFEQGTTKIFEISY